MSENTKRFLVDQSRRWKSKQLMKIIHTKKSMMKQTNNSHTTLQNELTCLKEAFQDHVNRTETENHKTEMNNRQKEETEVDWNQKRTRHLN